MEEFDQIMTEPNLKWLKMEGDANWRGQFEKTRNKNEKGKIQVGWQFKF